MSERRHVLICLVVDGDSLRSVSGTRALDVPPRQSFFSLRSYAEQKVGG